MRSRPQTRYLAGCLALLLMVGVAAKTYHARYHALTEEARAIATPSPIAYKHSVLTFSQCRSCHTLVDGLPDNYPDADVPPPATPDVTPIPQTESHLLTWGAGIWLVGVSLLSLRLVISHVIIQRLRRSHSGLPDPSILASLARISEQLGVKSSVQIHLSKTVAIPTVIGWFRPVILLPAVSIVGLSRIQLDAILAHELAHIRRRDYPVNFLQHILEIVFFFQPAVWWVSSTIRKEREYCCDDIAATISQSVIDYARALTTLENLRDHHPTSLGMAANGGSLLTRIKRLGGDDISKSKSLLLSSAFIFTAAISIPLTILPSHANTPGNEPSAGNVEILPLSSNQAEAGLRHLMGKTSKADIPDEDFTKLTRSLSDVTLLSMIEEVRIRKDHPDTSSIRSALIAELNHRETNGPRFPINLNQVALSSCLQASPPATNPKPSIEK